MIESFLFFDIETTGLPWQEKNQTKITELSLVAVLKKDLLLTQKGESPPLSKLTLVFNPMRPIDPVVVQMNGLSNDLLKHAPLFSQKLDTISSFLQELPKPICLVAHNGNKFDYKILLAECQDANFHLPNDLLCVDSLVGFKKIHADKVANACGDTLEKIVKVKPMSQPNVEDLITDDEDEWPNLNVSTEEWEDIDKLCDSLSDISCEDIDVKRTSNRIDHPKKKANRSKVIQSVFKKNIKKAPQNENKESFTLLALYRRLLNKEPRSHHRAEDDCLMLLECIVATKEDFVPWAEASCVKLTEIKPLIRY